MKLNIKYDEIPVYHDFHGLVKITSTEKEILHWIYFKRLKKVKKLSFAYYVLPGAVHTRFSHSIGVLAVVEKILNRLIEIEGENNTLSITETDVKILRMAGLLYDIGHYPFSHLDVTRILIKNGFTLRDIKDISLIIPRVTGTN